MEGTIRSKLEEDIALTTDELQKAYKVYVYKMWDECISKSLRKRIVINFDNGRVTAIQDQAVIAGVSAIGQYLDMLN
jgi:hypothetical protein